METTTSQPWGKKEPVQLALSFFFLKKNKKINFQGFKTHHPQWLNGGFSQGDTYTVLVLHSCTFSPGIQYFQGVPHVRILQQQF